MFIDIKENLKERKEADALVIPVWKEKKKIHIAASFDKVLEEIDHPIQAGDVEAKEGELTFLYLKKQPEKRLVLLGLGENDFSMESLRRSFGSLTKACHKKKKIQSLNILLPQKENLTEDELIQAVIEGLTIPNSTAEMNKKEKTDLLQKVCLYGVPKSKKDVVNTSLKTMEGVYLARDLINENADTVTPLYLEQKAKELQKKFSSLSVTVFDEKRIEKEGLGLLAAVGRGGMVPPRFIILQYKGNPKSKDLTAIIGKGVTYDTGGLNIKPTGGMETMKSDMSGGAAILGTMYAIASLKPQINVVALIPSAENATDGKSYKPGDVYKSYAGHTVEIGNTDAEGRLLLADALSYAVKNFKPSRIIDIATLTGACIIALGIEAIGLFSNDDSLAKEVEKSGNFTFERVWRMPLFPEYREMIKSDIADLRNIGPGRQAGAIVAAKFLEEFVEKTPWAHLDIAGKGYLEENKRYYPKYATGIGVRLLVDFLLKSDRKTDDAKKRKK